MILMEDAAEEAEEDMHLILGYLYHTQYMHVCYDVWTVASGDGVLVRHS
jgi:hypothetical protein